MKDYRQANKGMPFEELIKFANERYRQLGKAVICKIPTEILPIRNHNGSIISAKICEKSTVDFIGRVKEKPIAIEAKHTSGNSIRWDAVQDHQASFLTDFCAKGEGISIVLVSFNLKRFYAVPAPFWIEAREAWIEDPKSKRTIEYGGQKWTTNGKASVRADELMPEWEIPMGGRVGIDYLRRYI